MARFLSTCLRIIYVLVILVTVISLLKLHQATFVRRDSITSDGRVKSLSDNIVKTLNDNKLNSPSDNTNISQTKPTLVLFTTFVDESSLKPYHVYAHRLVIKNWLQLSPRVRPVLFVKNSTSVLTRLARDAGWDVIPLTSFNKYGTPKFIPMIRQIFATYNSTYYGFANGDIIFGETLLRTLKGIERNLTKLNDNVLVMGRRRNTFLNKQDPDKKYDIENYESLFLKSTKYRYDALDYLIFTREGITLKWNSLADVVIGRKGYDNYLVSKALEMGVNVIDASKTLEAVHLTPPNGTHEKRINADRRYNVEVVGGKFNYSFGSSYSAKLYTAQLDNGDVCVYRKGRPAPPPRAVRPYRKRSIKATRNVKKQFHQEKKLKY